MMMMTRRRRIIHLYVDDIEHMTEMVDKYMKIEDTNIRDTIPKYIMLMLGKI